MSMGRRYQRAVQRIVESRAAARIAELQAEMAEAEAAIEAAEAEHDCINTELAAANSALHRALAQRIALEQSGAPDEVATSSVIARLDDIAPTRPRLNEIGLDARKTAPSAASIACALQIDSERSASQVLRVDEVVPAKRYRPIGPHKGIR